MPIHLSVPVPHHQALSERATQLMAEVWAELSHSIRVRGGNPLTAEVSFGPEQPMLGIACTVTARGEVDTSTVGWDADGAPVAEWPR